MSVSTEEPLSSSDPASPRGMNAVRIWLFVIGMMVIAMVLVGGATRLTDSGLSITEWKPIHGAIPPLNDAEWQEEFEKYKQIPEYKQINRGMSLAEFQTIYWWEWGHRLLGRTIGLVFAVPLAIFWFAGFLSGWLKPRLLLLLGLGGLQGLIGWWMVTSGLAVRTDVSQYRLAVHLTLAFFILAYTAWLYACLTPSWSPAPEQATEELPRAAAGSWSVALLVLLFIQIFLGGLVAGLDAGLTFNTWPLMDGAFIPSGLWIMDPGWINHFENVLTVQFQHRMTAYLLVLFVALIVWRAYAIPSDPRVRGAALLVLGLTCLQALSGIVTLVLQVPLGWALVHQGLASLLLVAIIVLVRLSTGPRQPA